MLFSPYRSLRRDLFDHFLLTRPPQHPKIFGTPMSSTKKYWKLSSWTVNKLRHPHSRPIHCPVLGLPIQRRPAVGFNKSKQAFRGASTVDVICTVKMMKNLRLKLPIKLFIDTLQDQKVKYFAIFRHLAIFVPFDFNLTRTCVKNSASDHCEFYLSCRNI